MLALLVGVMLTWSRRLWRMGPFYWLLLLVGYTTLATPVVADSVVRVDDETLATGLPQVIRRGEPGLSSADDQCVDSL